MKLHLKALAAYLFLALCSCQFLPADFASASPDLSRGTELNSVPSSSRNEGNSGVDETMVMFVGEDIEVLSLASRREESAWSAPAAAEVVKRDRILSKGDYSLSRVLEDVSGFYLAEKEGGYKPYLRGMENSALFLYDTVPMGSYIDRSSPALSRDMSLMPVKKIEIVKGAASVLWGPDAFSGVVNVVPLNGRDVDGLEAGVISQDEVRGGYLNYGIDRGIWNAFLSVSGRQGKVDDRGYNILSFFQENDTPAPLENRYGRDEPDSSDFMEIIARFNYNNWLDLSLRLTDNSHSYSVFNAGRSLSWQETKETTSQMLKLEVSRKFTYNSGLRFTGYLTRQTNNREIIDLEREETEEELYAELIYDNSFFDGSGLLTGGLSFRKEQVDDFPEWDSFFPDYLGRNNLSFLPSLENRDFTTRLKSLFGQYRHTLGNMEFCFGLRFDDANLYQDSTSFSAAAVWTPWEQAVFKLLYGTAYRTPYVKQLLAETLAEPEKVENIGLQASWKPAPELTLTGGLFHNDIDNHILQDKYAGAGLSLPNQQDIWGVELEGRWQMLPELELRADLTLLDHSGPPESYLYNDYSLINPDGSLDKHYTRIDYNYDPGAKNLFNLSTLWTPGDDISLSLDFRYHSSTHLYYTPEEKTVDYPGVWLTDLSCELQDLITPGLDLTVFINNLLDENYQIPGRYSTLKGQGLEAGFILRKEF